MSDPSSIVGLVFLILMIVFVFAVAPKLDRDRIRENIESHGGKVIEILRAWGSGSRYDRAYEVSYMTASGKRVQETCRTSMGSGVYWINTRPPGLDSGESNVFSRNTFAKEPSEPAEPIQCLDCGARIPASKASCPQCGWSYRAHRAGE